VSSYTFVKGVGLYYYGALYYDPGIRRFLMKDPSRGKR
jgi:RHS repeat-associated protein